MKTVLAAAIALVLSVVIGAQEGRFRTSVETVSIYATVSDADGRLVPDLVKEDFTVLDNGAPRDITLFSNETQPITVVVMLDMSGSMFSRFVRLRTSTISFVDALQPRRPRANRDIRRGDRDQPASDRRQAAAQARAEHRAVAEWARHQSGTRSTRR